MIGLRLMAAVLAFKPITLSIISCRVAALRAMLRGVGRRHKHHMRPRLGRLKEKPFLDRASDPFAHQIAHLSAVLALERKAMRQIFQGIDLRRALLEDIV